MNKDPTIKVTKIGSRWHARVMEGTKVHSEMACALQVDIGYICRQLLRWYDKCGGMSIHASKSRNRLNTKETNYRGPVGKIWWPAHLPTKRTKKGIL